MLRAASLKDSVTSSRGVNLTVGDWYDFPAFDIGAPGRITGAIVVFDKAYQGLGEGGLVKYTIEARPTATFSKPDTYVSNFYTFSQGDSIGIDVVVPYNSTQFARLSSQKFPSPPPMPPPVAVAPTGSSPPIGSSPVPPIDQPPTIALVDYPRLFTAGMSGTRNLVEGSTVPWIYYFYVESQPKNPVNITIGIGNSIIHSGRMEFSVNNGAFKLDSVSHEVNQDTWGSPIKVTVRVPEDDIVEDVTPLDTFVYHGYQAQPSNLTLPVSIRSNDRPGIQVMIPGVTHSNTTYDNVTFGPQAYQLIVDEGANVTSWVALMNRARPTVSVAIKYKLITDSVQSTGLSISPAANFFTLNDAALTFKSFILKAVEDNKVTGDRIVDMRLETVSSLYSYGCEGAYSAFQRSVCGDLFRIVIKDNDRAGVLLGEIPPDDPSLLSLWTPSTGERNTTIMEGVSFGTNGSYSFGMTLRAEPNQAVIVKPVVTEIDSGSVVTDQVVMSPLSVTFQPTQWNTPQKIQIMANSDNTVEGTKLYRISWIMQSADSSFNEVSELDSAVRVTVLDADQANITLTKLSSDIRFTETGEPVRYSIKLSSLPTANVTLNFAPRISTNDAAYGAYLNRRAIFTAQSPSIDSFVKVTPPSITIVNGSSDSVTFDVGFGSSTDGQVTGDVPVDVVVTTDTQDIQYTSLTETILLRAVDEDKLGFIIENTDKLLEENGTDVKIGIKLKTKPLSALRVLVTAPVVAGGGNQTAQINITNATSAASGVDVIFTPHDWNVFQYVNLTAIDDSLVEQVHSAIVRFTGATAPANYLSNNVSDLFYVGYSEDRVVLIEDNDLAVANKTVDVSTETTLKTSTNIAAAFPPGAINTNTVFKVAELKTTDIAAPMNATEFKPKAATVSFEPSTNFSKPVTISIPLPDGVTDDTSAMHFVGASSASAGDWAPVNGTVCRNDTATSKQICSVDVEHFSLYTIATITPTLQATSCAGAALTCGEEVVIFTEDGPQLPIWPAGTIAVLPGMEQNRKNPDFKVSMIVITVSTGYVSTEDNLRANLTSSAQDGQGCWVGKMPVGADLASEMNAKVCWDNAIGQLTIANPVARGTISLANARDALRQVTYRNTNVATPNTQNRRFSVTIKEPYSEGAPIVMSRYVTVQPVNDPPTVTTTAHPRKYVEASDAVRVDPNIVVADVDNLLKSAKVTMRPYSTLAKSTDRIRSTLGAASVTGISYLVDTSVPGEYTVKFSGDASANAYRNALRSITFQNEGPYIQSTNRTFTFSVTDLNDATGTAERVLVITKVNNAPEVSRTPMAIAVNEDQEVTWSIDGATDCDTSPDCKDPSLNFNVTCPPSKGTVYTTPGSPQFRYVPDPDAFGTDTFVYQAFDGELTSNLGSVQITINPIDDNPKVSNLVLPTAVTKMTVCSAAQRTETEAAGDFAACGGLNFTMPGRDPDNPGIGFNLDAYFIMTEPQYGTLTIANSGQTADSQALRATREGKNPAYYTLTKEELGGQEPTSVNFTFRVRNALGRYSPEATPGVVTINLQYGQEVNTPPVTDDSTETMSEDTVLNGNVRASDPDVGEALTLTVQTQAANGVVAIPDANALGFTYTPNRNFVGTDTFTYRVTDRRQATATGKVTITVTNVNDPPFGACSVPANIPAATATLAAADYAKIKGGTSGSDNLIPTGSDHIFEGVTAGMTDHQVARQWLKNPPGTSKLLELDLLTGALEKVGTRAEILNAWHVACGSSVFADGGSTSDRYLIALVGYDVEVENLFFVIDELPAVGKLFRASYVAGGVLTKGAEIVVDGTSNVIPAAQKGAAGLLWYEPVVTYAGPITITWSVIDATVQATGPGNVYSGGSEKYIFGTVFECGPGYVRNVDQSTGTVSCVPCAAGQINQQDIFGQLRCLPCPRGESQPEEGQTSCVGCAAGTYNPIVAQPTCATCPVADTELMTSKVRSVSVNACYCKTGSFKNSTGADKRCFECSPFTLCDEIDQIIPKSKDPGYWIDPTDGNVVVACNPPGACITHETIAGVLSGNCTDGYVDNVPGCRQCDVGYYRDLQGGFGYCVGCPEVPWYTYAIGAAVLLLMLPLLLKVSKLQNGFGAINIFISYAQVLSMFSELNFEWPVSVQEMFKDLSVFNLNFFSLSPPECLSSDWSYLNKFWITASMPLLYIVGFSAIGLVAYVHFLLNKLFRPMLHVFWPDLKELYPASGEDVPDEEVARINKELVKNSSVVRRIWNGIGHQLLASLTPLQLRRFLFSLGCAFMLFLLWFYFQLTETTFDYFDCVEAADGKSYMRGDPGMECWNWGAKEPNLHAQLFPLAIFAVLAYPIGIMALFGTLMWKFRFVLKQRSKLNAISNPTEEEAELIETLRKCERRFGFLFRRYEDNWYWWELVILGRKLLYSMCGTLLASPMEQLLTMIILLTAFASVFLNARPYDKSYLDAMECISLISNLILLFSGFMFFSELLNEEDTDFTAYCVQILLVTSLVVLAIFIIADTLPSVYWVYRETINERKQAKLDEARVKKNLALSGGDSGKGLQQRTLKSNLGRLRMIAKATAPPRITKVMSAAGQCFNKDVVDKLRDYLWMDGIGDVQISEVERYVYYVNNARMEIEAKKKREDAMKTAAAEARAEGRDADADAMIIENDAPVRLGYVLNPEHAEEFTYWMAFEAGANEQHTLVSFLDFFKKWEKYERRTNATGFLGSAGRATENAA